MREHLANYQKQTGKVHPRMAQAVELPDGCEQLWSDFLDLHASRGSNGFGPSRITFVDIDAWERVNRLKLRPWQIDAIRKADIAFLASLPKPKAGAK